MKRLRALVGILLIPFAASFSASLYTQIGRIHSYSKHQSLFLGGLIFYLILHTLFFKPKYLYIFGHELSHAIAALLAGGKIFRFRVSSQGGSISSDKSNLFIALAPYLFPLYTILLAFLYFAASFFWNMRQLTSPFIFLIGATLCFHLVMTVEFLKIKQPDMTKGGYLLSILLIYIVNLCFLAVVLGFIFPQFYTVEFFEMGFTGAISLTRDALYAIL